MLQEGRSERNEDPSEAGEQAVPGSRLQGSLHEGTTDEEVRTGNAGDHRSCLTRPCLYFL